MTLNFRKAIVLWLVAATSALVGCGTVGNGTSSTSGPATVTDPPVTTPTNPPTNEENDADSLQFSASSYSVAQADGAITLTVTRSSSNASAISVDFATADGSARDGTDYTTVNGTLQWAENDATSKTISIPLDTSSPFLGDKSFNIVLSNPSDGAQIGSPGSATIMISGAAVASIGAVQFSDSTYSISQNGKSVDISVNRSGGSAGAISVSYATADDSASAAEDYTSTKGTLNWDDGDSSAKTFSVPVSDSHPFTGSRKFHVNLSNATAGAMIGDPDTATVTINGTGAAAAVGSLQLSKSSFSVDQDDGTLKVSVNRTGGSNGSVSVSYATKNGSAAAGTDYTSASGTLKWSDGDTASKSFYVTISNSKPFTGSRTFNVAISSPSSGATISSPGSATATISGSASPAVGSLQLSASSYAVSQDDGHVTFKVTRNGGSNGAVSIAYGTTSGSATSGNDYTGASGTLNWSDGDTGSKSVSVAVSNSHPFSGTRSFTVALSSPSNGAGLGSPGQAIITITGDAASAAGNVQLSSSSYSVAQNGSTVKLTVNRSGGSSGAASVEYATSDQSASAGDEYTAKSGTLSWNDGDASSKSISISVSNATPFTGSRTFGVKLSDASGGVSLSSPTSATVTITGSGTVTNPPPGSTFWVYKNGTFNWGGDYSFAASINYRDTSGKPMGGNADIAVTIFAAYGGFLPYAGGTVPLWNFDDSPYNYLTFALKPTVANQSAHVYFVKVGDIPVGVSVDPFNGSYGPKPQPGVWATYRIPLSALGVSRTSVYKFGIQDQTGLNNNVFYLDNIAFE